MNEWKTKTEKVLAQEYPINNNKIMNYGTFRNFVEKDEKRNS